MGVALRRYARLGIVLLAVSLAPIAAFGQTAVVVNPRTLTFTSSADQNATLPDGSPALDHYDFDVYSVGAAQPFESTNIGKPMPAADGLIYYDFSTSVAGWPLPGGNYEARVVAVGPMGSGTSSASNAFTFSSCTYTLSGTSASLPAAGGGTEVSVTTASGCTWTAASNVSWVALTPTTATGNATVVATVAANTTSSPRTATLTVAGQPFSINEAGTSVLPPSAPALPSPWQNQDVGAVVLPGSGMLSNGTFTVEGSGADIWGTTDAFQYVNQPVIGNVEIVARLTGEQNTDPYAKAGLMLREALTAGSAHVILDVRPDGEVEFMTRSSAGGSTTYIGGAMQAAPAWLKLTRSGNTVTGAVSSDGATWQSVGSVTVTMAATGYAGLAVTSHNAATANTATFDGVSMTALGSTVLPSGWSNQDVGSVGLAGSAGYSSGTFTVTGAGADIWGPADGFQYAWRTLAGDGQIVARVTSLQNTNTYAKAGVMLRSALTAGSAHVILDLVPSGGVEFMTRSASGGSTSYLGGTTQAAPCWLLLVRSGSTVTASVSADGTTWRTVGSTTLPSGAAYIGLAVTSHNTAVRNTATFDSVVVK